MKFAWANIVLLMLLLGQLITGYFGFTNGRQSSSWILWLHGIGAYALVLLMFWKGQIVWDAVRRKTVWTRQRIGFMAMLCLLLATLLAGLLWTFSGPIYVAGFSLVSLHIYLAIPLLLLMAWHVWRMRFIWRVPGARGRRVVLATASLGVAGWLFWAASNRAKTRAGVAGAQRRFTGSFARGSFSPAYPAVSWILDRPPAVDSARYRLRVGGAVARPLSLSYAQLRAEAVDSVTAILDCTGGWYTEQEWSGISITRLLAQAGLTAAANSVTFRSLTGYQRRFSLEEVDGYLLALDVASAPLSAGHGFPLRLVAVNQRGVNWVKWISHIQVNETSRIWQLPLPLR